MLASAMKCCTHSTALQCTGLRRLGQGATPVAVPETNLRTDVDAFLGMVSPQTKLVFIANPNNPTGSYISEAEVKRLADGLPSNVVIVLDAAYAEYVSRNDYADGAALVDAYENVVMMRTFSKIHGLAAVPARLGLRSAGDHRNAEPYTGAVQRYSSRPGRRGRRDARHGPCQKKLCPQ